MACEQNILAISAIFTSFIISFLSVTTIQVQVLVLIGVNGIAIYLLAHF